jgi:hypothetical protein
MKKISLRTYKYYIIRLYLSKDFKNAKMVYKDYRKAGGLSSFEEIIKIKKPYVSL